MSCHNILYIIYDNLPSVRRVYTLLCYSVMYCVLPGEHFHFYFTSKPHCICSNIKMLSAVHNLMSMHTAYDTFIIILAVQPQLNYDLNETSLPSVISLLATIRQVRWCSGWYVDLQFWSPVQFPATTPPGYF